MIKVIVFLSSRCARSMLFTLDWEGLVLYVYVNVYVYINVYVSVYVYLYIYDYVYVYLFVYVYVHILYIYIRILVAFMRHLSGREVNIQQLYMRK